MLAETNLSCAQQSPTVFWDAGRYRLGAVDDIALHRSTNFKLLHRIFDHYSSNFALIKNNSVVHTKFTTYCIFT